VSRKGAAMAEGQRAGGAAATAAARPQLPSSGPHTDSAGVGERLPGGAAAARPPSGAQSVLSESLRGGALRQRHADSPRGDAAGAAACSGPGAGGLSRAMAPFLFPLMS
jgi:hypothetical protein